MIRKVPSRSRKSNPQDLMDHQTRTTRIHEEFKAAVIKLDKCLPLDIRSGLPNDQESTEQIKEKLESLLEHFLSARKNQSSSQAKAVFLKWFRVLYPFSTLFIEVAKEGASVSSSLV